MPVEIRQGRHEDADFLAGVMLSASRAHLARGVWDLIIGGDEAICLDYLRRLAVAQPRSLCHCESFLVADVDGRAAAALSGYDMKAGWALVGEAMANVQRDLGWTEAHVTASQQRAGPVWACFLPDIGADWSIENVAARPEYRRQGLVKTLLDSAIKEAVGHGGKLVQIVTYIGNDEACTAYQHSGFRLLDEKRCAGFEAILGSPGFVRLIRDL
jgi:ribosomal protein S18 acetylase RimI-like enzyme